MRSRKLPKFGSAFEIARNAFGPGDKRLQAPASYQLTQAAPAIPYGTTKNSTRYLGIVELSAKLETSHQKATIPSFWEFQNAQCKIASLRGRSVHQGLSLKHES
jgi:hypothetical protein